jgi:membrane protease YdiL (CAAX protease family)
MIALLPFQLLLTFTAQKTRSTVPGMIAHGTMNFVTIIMITLVVSGLK